MAQLEHERGFNGTIGRTIQDSERSWTDEPKTSRPNIVVIVLDDVGYSQLGCYGSSIDTPALDRLADNGLRYANFHVTPLCSPTRACLLTGRNHHAVGMSRVTEMGNGFPNTAGFVAREAGTLAEMLKPSGYRTMCVGKWHLVLSAMQSPAGPYRSLAAAARLRPLLRIPLRRDQPVESRTLPRQRANRRAAPRRIRRRLSPLRSDRRSRHALAAPARLGR